MSVPSHLAGPRVGSPVIIGGGLAGLLTALAIVPEPVLLLCKGPLGQQTSSSWAQGGLAAAVGPDDDPAQHLTDTLAAGGGLVDPAAAARITRAGPTVVEMLTRLGVRFDRDAAGALRLGLEAAHGRRRIVHADGDGSGREIIRAAVAAVRASPKITVLEGYEARRILIEDGHVVGLLTAGPGGPMTLVTRRVVLATGGVGGLFQQGTNPTGSFGSGLALAARAGAVIADPEFVQFHPTALNVPQRSGQPMPLVSEAVRGEGAVLVDERGARFMADVPGAELAPRDVVARAIWRHAAGGHRTFLDARSIRGFATHFPQIAGLCQAAGIDPATQAIPVCPAVHYHMGGIAVDKDGRSSVPGLWAVGEVASTGLHGANRLASNSLLEAAACADPVGRSVSGTIDAVGPRPRPAVMPPAADPDMVRPLVSRGAGVLRDGVTLRATARQLLPLAQQSGAAADPAAVALLLVVGALQREESRGGHFRTDFPCCAARAYRTALTLEDALEAARELPHINRSA